MVTNQEIQQALDDRDEYRLWVYYNNYGPHTQVKILTFLIENNEDKLLTYVVGKKSIMKWHLFIAADHGSKDTFERLLRTWQGSVPTDRSIFFIVEYLANTANPLFFDYVNEVDDNLIRCGAQKLLLQSVAHKMAGHLKDGTCSKDSDKVYYNILLFLLQRGVDPNEILENDRETIVDYFVANGTPETFEMIRPIANGPIDKGTFIDKIWGYISPTVKNR